MAHFLGEGFDVYNIDWGVPTQAERHLGMDDYVERYIDGIVDHLRERTGSDRVNILGYCMGGTMSAIYTALHPEKVKNLMLMAAPVDWSSREHLLAKWTDPRYYDVDRLIDVHGNVPAEMLQGAFSLLRPVSNMVAKYVTFYERLEDRKFLEDYFAMEAWLNDNIPVAGALFKTFVKELMQQNKLIAGEFRVGGRNVDLGRITCPVLNLAAEHDHLVPCEQSLPLKHVVGSKDYEAITFPAGHIGLAVGSKANRELWPHAAQWLAQRSD